MVSSSDCSYENKNCAKLFMANRKGFTNMKVTLISSLIVVKSSFSLSKVFVQLNYGDKNQTTVTAPLTCRQTFIFVQDCFSLFPWLFLCRQTMHFSLLLSIFRHAKFASTPYSLSQEKPVNTAGDFLTVIFTLLTCAILR